MLYACNFPRLLMMKYLPLMGALVMLFVFVPQMIKNHSGSWPDIALDVAFPLMISILLLVLFIAAKNKLRYVAIGKMKVIINRGGQEIEYRWTDVEHITLNRFLGLYRLKTKNEDEIYFTPYGMTTWLMGDNSDMGVIINKIKRELQI